MSRVTRGAILRVLLTAALGVGAALVVSACGSSDKLIPVAAAVPLQSDFESVAQAAEGGGGNCSTTEAALLKTEQDFSALPATVDSGLHARLQEGIAKLREDALARCAKPLGSSNTTSTSKAPARPAPTKTQTTSTSTETQSTSTQTTTTGSTPTSTGPGGGTQAPEEGTAGSGQPGAGEQSPGTQSPPAQGPGGKGGGTGVGEAEGTGAGTPGAGEGVK